MPTADTTFQETEQEIVERWRAQELERAGFPEDVATELAVRTDVDLHRAIDLIRRGCTPELAARILLYPLADPGGQNLPVLGYIPSPHTGVVDLGPVQLHMYGLTLLVAILACIGLTGRRWVAQGGDWDLVTRVAVWGVAFGVIGARAYHDVTSWNEVPTPKWQGIFEVWKGGLGVWGGILLGALVGAMIVRRAGASVPLFMDAVAPGLLLAQGIGRIGNWWNQELYGKPTKLPWGLKIDAAHLPADPKYLAYSTFHPTFLYELIWDLVGVFVLLCVGRRFSINPPNLFALYVAWYCFGRFFEELLRIDPAHHIAGLRLNAWVSIVVFVVRSATSCVHQRRPRAASGAEAPRAAEAGAHDGDPQGPRPVAPVPCRRCPSPCASSSWTWTRSKGRSTFCSRSSFAKSCRCARSTSRTSSSRSSSISPRRASSTSTRAASF